MDHDVDLVDRIDDKVRYVELGATIAYRSKTLFTDVFGSVKLWDVLIYDYLINKRNLVLPRKKENIKKEKNIYIKF